jgi:hypothetical protein
MGTLLKIFFFVFLGGRFVDGGFYNSEIDQKVRERKHTAIELDPFGVLRAVASVFAAFLSLSTSTG